MWLRYGRGVRESVKGGPYVWVAGWIMDRELLKRILFGRRIKSLFLVCWFWDGIGICKRNFLVGKWICTSRALRGGLSCRYTIVNHHIQVPIKGTGVGEIAREKRGLTVELRKTLAFTHWVEEVKPEKEVEKKLLGSSCTRQEQWKYKW